MAQLAAQRTFFLEAAPFDPATSAQVNVYLCSHEWSTGTGDTPASQPYTPGMSLNGFGASILDLDNGMVGGVAELENGTITVPIPPDVPAGSPTFHKLARYIWQGYAFTVYVLEKGQAFSARTVYRKGFFTGYSGSEGLFAVTATALNSTLSLKPIQPEKFTGRKYGVRFKEGIASYVSIGDLLDQAGSFTIELRWKSDAASTNAGYIADKGKYATNSWGAYADGSGSDNLRFYVEGGWDLGTTGAPMADRKTHFYSCVYDTTANKARIFVDGALNVEDDATVDPVGNAATLMFGNNDATYIPTGLLSEVRIWNVARTAEEIATYQYGGFDGVPANLVGWWKFDDGTGNTVTDSAETPHNGTLSGPGARTYHLYNATASGSSHAKIDEAATSAVTTGTGWTPGTTAPTKYSLMLVGTERGSGTFGSSALPNTAPGTNDCWRSESKFSGSFAAGSFSVAAQMIAVTAGGAIDGAINVRLFHGKSANGSDAIEFLTTGGGALGIVTGSTITNLGTGTPQTSTASCTILETRFEDEYLFVQIAFKLTGAGGGSTEDVLIRSQNSTVTTTAPRPAWYDTYEGEESLAGVEKPWAVGANWEKEPVQLDAAKWIYSCCPRGFTDDGLGNFPNAAPIVREGGLVVPIDSDVAAKTFKVYNATAPSSSHGKMDTPATSALLMVTGWTVGTTAAGKYSLLLWGTERAAATFGSTALPNAAPTTNDCIRSNSTITGRFVAGLWTLKLYVMADAAGGVQDGRIRLRLWKSANADGSGATEITTATGVGSTITDVSASTKKATTVTVTCPTVDFAAEYLFAQLAWEITGAGNGANQDVLLRAQDSTLTTPGFSSGGTTSESDLGVATVAPGFVKYDATLGLIRFGSEPTGRISVSFCAADYDGDNTYEPKGQVRAIVEGSGGFAPADVSVAQTDFYPASQPALQSGIYYRQGGATCIQALQRVLNNHRASGGFQSDGIFRARAYTKARLSGAAPSQAYTKDHIKTLPLRAMVPAIKEISTQYKPYEPAYGPTEFVGAVDQATRFDLTKGYRILPKLPSTDRYGNSFALYKEGARKIVVQTDLTNDWMLAYAIQPILDAFDAPIRVGEFDLPAALADLVPTIGDLVTVAYPAWNFDGVVKCLVTGVWETQPAGEFHVQVMDATTLAS